MGWEMRGPAGPYYTRSRRVGRRIVREYLGRGPLAEAIAHLDELQRSRREEENVWFRGSCRQEMQVRGSLLDLSSHLNQLLHAALCEAGYHQRRGQWRRQRQGLAT